MKNRSVEINAFLSEPHLIQVLVESLVTSRVNAGNSLETMPVGWRAIDNASLECYAMVDVAIRTGTESMKVPFTCCFLFTCSKMKRTGYNLTWIRSIS